MATALRRARPVRAAPRPGPAGSSSRRFLPKIAKAIAIATAPVVPTRVGRATGTANPDRVRGPAMQQRARPSRGRRIPSCEPTGVSPRCADRPPVGPPAGPEPEPAAVPGPPAIVLPSPGESPGCRSGPFGVGPPGRLPRPEPPVASRSSGEPLPGESLPGEPPPVEPRHRSWRRPGPCRRCSPALEVRSHAGSAPVAHSRPGSASGRAAG